MNPLVYLPRPSCTISLVINADGEGRLLPHTSPQVASIQVRDLVQAVMNDIEALPSVAALRAAIDQIPKPAEQPLDTEQALAAIGHSTEDASLIQAYRQQPAAFVLTINPQGIGTAGFAIAGEFCTETVKTAATEVSCGLVANPSMQRLQEAIQLAANAAN